MTETEWKFKKQISVEDFTEEANMAIELLNKGLKAAAELQRLETPVGDCISLSHFGTNDRRAYLKWVARELTRALTGADIQGFCEIPNPEEEDDDDWKDEKELRPKEHIFDGLVQQWCGAGMLWEVPEGYKVVWRSLAHEWDKPGRLWVVWADGNKSCFVDDVISEDKARMYVGAVAVLVRQFPGDGIAEKLQSLLGFQRG